MKKTTRISLLLLLSLATATLSFAQQPAAAPETTPLEAIPFPGQTTVQTGPQPSVQQPLQQPAAPSTPEKATLIVDYFGRAPEVPPIYTEAIRDQVVGAFVRRGRHNVIDLARSGLPQPNPNLIQNPSALINPNRAAEEARNNFVASSGAEYIVTGTVTRYLTKRTVSNGKANFSTIFSVALTGVNTRNGQTSPPEQIDLHGFGSTPAEADARAIESGPIALEFYIDRNYKFVTRILRLGEPDAKGRIRELYLGCGAAFGVHRGDLFKVYLVSDIGGAAARKEIGRLKAREVQGAEVTLCTIPKGGAEIADALLGGGGSLLVVSDSEALF